MFGTRKRPVMDTGGPICYGGLRIGSARKVVIETNGTFLSFVYLVLYNCGQQVAFLVS